MTDAGTARQRGLLLLLGTGLLWGTIGIAAKLIYRETTLDAVSVTWLRAAVAAPVCLALGWSALGRDLFRAPRRELALMALLGVILIFYQWAYLAAIDRIGVAPATLIALCVPPALVALASILFFGETMDGRLAVALTGALFGTALLVGRPEAGASEPGATVAGVVLALASATGLAAHVLASRFLAGRHPTIRPLAIAFSVGVIVFAPVALGRGVAFAQPPVGWLLLVYLGVVPSALAYVMFQRGLRDVAATTASVLTLIEPLTAAILAWLLFGERLSPLGFVGGALLLGAILLLSRRTVGERRMAEEPVAA
ncbi:MAG TPA: EamA family transporter [Thermomicrobiales bacterium]|nr:EamA family transporter [Thermomicrobiales bacterium]